MVTLRTYIRFFPLFFFQRVSSECALTRNKYNIPVLWCRHKHLKNCWLVFSFLLCLSVSQSFNDLHPTKILSECNWSGQIKYNLTIVNNAPAPLSRLDIQQWVYHLLFGFVTLQPFRILLTPLFKVLFNFPPRSLFAIDFDVVFKFRLD